MPCSATQTSMMENPTVADILFPPQHFVCVSIEPTEMA
jgi:hypothetical protein